MNIYLENNSFYYEIEKLAALFLPNEKFKEIHSAPESGDTEYISVSVSEGDNITVRTKLATGGFADEQSREAKVGEDTELVAALLLYDSFVKLTGVSQPWGVLTGVRPIKLFRKLKEEGGIDHAVNCFTKSFLVSDTKTALAAETERYESEILKLTTPRSFSLYISIPFCPSRCSYCSFVSASTERTKHLIEPYTQLLCRELEETAKITNARSLRLESVYMGGGTPTTLDADQLGRVLSTVDRCFDMSECREFTVEAGRPDTITVEKLEAIKKYGADRISINPQTLSDSVLEAIGRRHSSEDVFRAFGQARECGFDHINMDLIAGLPTDTVSGFRKTVDGITALDPESITIHTLCMKRASNLSQAGKLIDRAEAHTAAEMVAYASETLHAQGYHPYYLYRQSRMAGNLENTGWSKKGKDGYYNVFIMEETQSIIACGAGGVTKLTSDGSSIERIFNYKYPYEYISGFDNLLARKKGVEDFYDKLR